MWRKLLQPTRHESRVAVLRLEEKGRVKKKCCIVTHINQDEIPLCLCVTKLIKQTCTVNMRAASVCASMRGEVQGESIVITQSAELTKTSGSVFMCRDIHKQTSIVKEVEKEHCPVITHQAGLYVCCNNSRFRKSNKLTLKEEEKEKKSLVLSQFTKQDSLYNPY